MPTEENTFLAAPRTRRNRAIAAVLALLVVLMLGALIQLAAQSGGGARRPSRALPAAPTQAAQLKDPAGVSATAGAGAVAGRQLPTGQRVVTGVRVGYPQTVVGAVAATVEYGTQVSSNLDLDRAAKIGLAIADDSFGDTAAYFVAGRVNTRQALGLPASGPVAAGASTELGALAYQVRDVQAEKMTVLLLAYLTVSSPKLGIRSAYGVFPYHLVWFGGDWKVSKRPAGAPDYSDLRRAPGTADASAAGWINLTR